MNKAIQNVKEDVSSKKLILLDILCYAAAPLVLLAVDVFSLPHKLIDVATKARPEHPLPYTLVSNYGVPFAATAIVLTAIILAIRLVISRKRWYLLIPSLASTLWFASFIRSRFLFG